MALMEASIVIPTYNKKKFLDLTLASLINQTYPADKFEVIIINDGSSDDTHQLSSAATHFPFRLVYLNQENSGRSAARNAGILKAEGKTIIFIDDDQIVPIQFVESHLTAHQRNHNLIVGGYRSGVFSFAPTAPEFQAILSYLRKSFQGNGTAFDVKPGCQLITEKDICFDFNRVTQLTYGMDANFERISKAYGEELRDFFIPWIFFVTSNVSVGKSHLVEVGLFDEKFTGWGGEDYELGYRLYKHGLQYTLSRGAISYHQHHSRNSKKQGESEIRNYQYFCEKHPDIAIFLYWRKTYDRLSIQTYNNIVREVEQLVEIKPDCQLLTDYKVLLKRHLETQGFDLAGRQQYWQLPSLAEKALQEKTYQIAIELASKYIHLNAHRADEQQSASRRISYP